MRQPAIRFLFTGILLLSVASCASVEVTRTSANSLLIDASGDPSCGASGAAKVASKSAAIETLRAGYDRYVITGGYSADNTHLVTLPGTYETTNKMRPDGTLMTRSRYIPGSTSVTGSYDRSLSVVMYRPGDQGYSDAIDAKSVLGSDWQRLVKEGIHGCM